MGLDVCLSTIGAYLIDIDEEDREEFEEEYKLATQEYEYVIREIKDLVSKQTGKKVEWNEKMPVNVDDIQHDERVGSYSLLHYLRRYAAHLDQNGKPPGKDCEKDPSKDPLLLKIYDEEVSTKFPHLIDHSDCSGYYIPCDFPKPLWLEPFESDNSDDEEFVEYISVGSSTKLLEELLEINKHLNLDTDDIMNDLSGYFEKIANDDLEIEKWCWSVLYYMSLNSKMLGIPVVFT